VITGSKRDLRLLVKEGSFREDLFYRLNVIPIQLPPLRERIEDLPLLVKHFFDKFFRARGKEPKALSTVMLEAFARYPWPGNVRELENTCERIAQTCICDAIVAGCVPATILFHKAVTAPRPKDGAAIAVNVVPDSAAVADDMPISLYERIHAVEVASISWALKATGGNKSRAAALLNVKRSTLGDRIKKLDLGHLESDSADSS
jgi:DNA-binding NtrC family response regulator